MQMSQGEIWPKQEEIIGDILKQQGTDEQVLQKRKNKKRVITNPNQLTGHWSELEHKTYIDFLNVHRAVMESQDQKKTSKIFKLMSETIGTRSPSQCRSHHQKFNPFLHSVKKRQKGAGRRKKENQQQEKGEKYQDNGFLQQLVFQAPYYQPQQFHDYSMMYQQFPLMFPLQELTKEDDKLQEQQQQQLYYSQYLLAQQQQLQQQIDDKNPCCYNINFLPQLSLNFNYLSQIPNEFQGLNDINAKDLQFDDQ